MGAFLLDICVYPMRLSPHRVSGDSSRPARLAALQRHSHPKRDDGSTGEVSGEVRVPSSGHQRPPFHEDRSALRRRVSFHRQRPVARRRRTRPLLLWQLALRQFHHRVPDQGGAHAVLGRPRVPAYTQTGRQSERRIPETAEGIRTQRLRRVNDVITTPPVDGGDVTRTRPLTFNSVLIFYTTLVAAVESRSYDVIVR